MSVTAFEQSGMLRRKLCATTTDSIFLRMRFRIEFSALCICREQICSPRAVPGARMRAV